MEPALLTISVSIQISMRKDIDYTGQPISGLHCLVGRIFFDVAGAKLEMYGNLGQRCILKMTLFGIEMIRHCE